MLSFYTNHKIYISKDELLEKDFIERQILLLDKNRLLPFVFQESYLLYHPLWLQAMDKM